MPDSFTPASDLHSKLEEAVVYRRALDEQLWPQFKVLKDLFSRLFVPSESRVSVSQNGKLRDSGRSGSSGAILKHISDLLYYKGGYPNPTSPPRMDALARQTAEAVRYLHLIGHLDEFREKLGVYGVDVVCSDKKRFKVELKPGWFADEKLRKDILAAGLDDLHDKSTPREVMEALVDGCLSLQGTICQTSNKVKIDIYSQVSLNNPSMRKPDFLELVKVRVLAEDAQVKVSSASKLKSKVKRKVASTQVAYRGLKVAAKPGLESTDE